MKELSLNKEYEKPFLKKSYRWYIFINFIINIIHLSQTEGILNPLGYNIMKDLSISQIEFDCLNLSYFIGQFTGSILFYFLYYSINRKYLLLFASISHAIINIFFLFTNKIYLFIALRAFSGIGNIWTFLYFQIWIKQYSIKKYKKFWKIINSICLPFGISIGYIIYLYYNNKWRFSFFYNGLILLFCGFVYSYFPNIYFSANLVSIKNKNINNKEGSYFNIIISSEDNDNNSKNIFKNVFFILLLWTNSINIFLLSTLQFWLLHYIILSFELIDNDKSLFILIFFYLITFNTLFGILIGYKYSSKISLKFIFIIQIISSGLFTPIPYMKNIFYFCILISLYKIFGNINIVFINKIIIRNLNKKEKKKAKDIINIFNVLFGTSLGPLIYSLILDKWNERNKNIGMIFLRNYLYLSLFLIIIAILKNKYLKNKNNNDYLEDDYDDIEMNDL